MDNKDKRDLRVVSEENARLIMWMCNLSGLKWYIKDKEGNLHLMVDIDE